MRLQKLSIIFFSLLLITACKQEEPATDSTVQTNTQQTVADDKVHPAKRSIDQGLKFKVNTMEGSVAEQLKAQEIAADRQLRQQHLVTGGMIWTTFDQIAEENKKPDGKKYLVDVYTEWCGWCKVMDKKTFTDPAIQDYLKKNFHIVKFDAEQRESVQFKGKTYDWVSGGRRGINTLAIELLGNRMSYPTLVYLDENMNKIQAIPGYKTPEQLIQELKAINEMKS